MWLRSWFEQTSPRAGRDVVRVRHDEREGALWLRSWYESLTMSGKGCGRRLEVGGWRLDVEVVAPLVVREPHHEREGMWYE